MSWQGRTAFGAGPRFAPGRPVPYPASPMRTPAHPATAAALLSVSLACATAAPAPSPVAPATASPPPTFERPGEARLKDVRRLTFGGQSAEAYWSFDGTQLILQARPWVDPKEHKGPVCDRIYRLPVEDALRTSSPVAGAPFGQPAMVPVSSGEGDTTCSYFLPGDKEIVYASTHLGGAACPPRADRSKGYVWNLFESYDVFRANADGTNVRRLTDAKGYDAEATVCGKDGSIVFTSVRDGDLELYRMDADGGNVKRLTRSPGYDGGAFFNADCTKIVWRASRPRGKDLDEYKELLAQGLVRPSKLEIWTMNADGSEQTQLTYLDTASFAPFFHPAGRLILFSSNAGDSQKREFDIFAIDADGTRLERVTRAPGFDGFPMFSPDGRLLAFGSNRAAEHARETDIFVARWDDGARAELIELPADRVKADVSWLADPARRGRVEGTPGLEAAGAFVEERLRELGLEPAAQAAGAAPAWRQPVPIPSGVAAFNVIARIPAGAPPAERLPGAVVIAAHFDRAAGPGAAPGVRLGADDDASGTAALLEAARELSQRRAALRRDVLVLATAGGEHGEAGAAAWARSAGEVAAVLDLDRVGRLRGNRLDVLGAGSAAEWPALVEAVCEAVRVECSLGATGHGPAARLPFAGLPALILSAGGHEQADEGDAPASINAAGLAQVALLEAELAQRVAARPGRLGPVPATPAKGAAGAKPKPAAKPEPGRR